MNTRPMHNRFFALEVVAAAVLLPGALTMPVLAASPVIASNVASDAATDMKPADANTPTVAANDIDDQKVTVRIKIALAGDNTLSPQAHEVSVATNPQAVILRGSVSPSEKERINSVAEEYAGARQIIDELLIRDM
jgi:osmotically-inducible protein OsmY